MIIMFLTAFSLTAVLMIAFAGNSYIRKEMARARFADATAWTADVPDMEFLLESIRGQEGVEAARVQRLIFSEYGANGVESDSEGQMNRIFGAALSLFGILVFIRAIPI